MDSALRDTLVSSPPSSPPPPLQENLSPTTAAPQEPAQPDQANSTSPPPPPGQSTTNSPEACELDSSSPIGGTPRGAEPPLSLSPWEMVASASPVLEAALSEEPSSPSPPVPVEAVGESREVEAAAPSPPSLPQIAEVLPEDSPPRKPSPTTPASTSGSLLGSSFTYSMAMASEEADGPSPALESMDSDPEAALPPPMRPLENEPKELLPQLHPRPPPPTAHLGCENSEPSELPPPTATKYALPDAAESDAFAATSEEAAGSAPASEATLGETDITPGEPSTFECDAEVSLQHPSSGPPSPPIEAEPRSPEMAPPGYEDLKSSWLPVHRPTLPAETAHPLLDSAAGPLHVFESMDAETSTAPGLPPASSEIGAERPSQQPLVIPPSPIAEVELCSPDMPPPGFENFKSSWLPIPTLPPPAETTCVSSDVIATKAVKLEGAAGPVPALEAMSVETDTARGLLPPLESRVKGLLQQPRSRPPSPTPQFEPCSPEMAPPGFENFKSSWQPPSTPLSSTAYVMAAASASESLSVTIKEETEPSPESDAMDVDMDVDMDVALEGGVDGSLQMPQSTMQDAPCSPDMAPPGFENFKSSKQLLPSPPLAQNAYTLHDPATAEAVSVREEDPQPPPGFEVIDVNMKTAPALPTSVGSGAEGSLPHQQPRLPSPKDEGTTCSPNMVPSGHENLGSLQLLPLPAPLSQVQNPDDFSDVVAAELVVAELEEVHHPMPVLEAKEVGRVPILPPPLESCSEGSLLQPGSQAHSHEVQVVDTRPDVNASNSQGVKSEEIVEPQPAMDANMDCATTSLALSESGSEESLPQLHHQPSSPNTKDAPCSVDSLELLPPPPPPLPCINIEMGQMVCGSCRELIAYPRGAVHVQCALCRTINLVLEAHEVGNVQCGQCRTLLMYPFGAPAVKCSLCLRVTEIREGNARARISMEQVMPPHPTELTNQG